MKSNITKYCVICQAPFQPDKRVEKRRMVCDKSTCQRARKKQSQTRWIEKNPDYFKGRYPQLKEQILRNRQKKILLHQNDETSIQDELTLNNNSLLNVLEKIVGIQDDLTDKITTTKRQLKQSINMVYKFI